MSKDPDHFNDLDLLAKRSPIFPIYGYKGDELTSMHFTVVINHLGLF